MTIENATALIPESIEGSSERGGWQCNATFINDQANAEYGRQCEIFIKSEGNASWDSEYHLALNGSILPQSLSFNRRQSGIPVIISTSDVFLANAGLQGIYFTNTTPSTNPHQIPNLNLGKIVEHIIEEHTNISTETAGGWVDTSRIDTLTSTSVDVYAVRNSNSIWSTIQNIADNEFYVRYFTKKDEMVYEPHPQFRSVPLNTVFEITESLLAGQPSISFRNDVKLDQIQAYGLTDTGQILKKFYPENIGTEGKKQKVANIRCNSQARLDVLAERIFKFLNRDINVSLQLVGAWGTMLEIYDRVSVTYTGTTKNGVTIAWDEKKFWINTIRVSKVGNFATITELELEEENL